MFTTYINKEQRTTNQIIRNIVVQIFVQQIYLIISASNIKFQTAFVSIKLVGLTNLENILKTSSVFGRRSRLFMPNLSNNETLSSLNLVRVK